MSKYGFSFSWKRLLGVTSVKQKIARQTGIPTTKQGIERKIGSIILNLLFNKKCTKMKTLNELKKELLADGVIDAAEVVELKEVLYADGVIDKSEAEFLFELNDAVSGKNNHESWIRWQQCMKYNSSCV